MGLKHKKILFWLLNVFYWLFFFSREYLYLLKYVGVEKGAAANILAWTFSLGFLFSILFRQFFIKKLSALPNLRKLTINYFLGLFSMTLLWCIVDLGISFFIWSEERVNQLLYEGNIIQYLFTYNLYFIVFMLWGSLYYIIYLWERVNIQMLQTKEAENLAGKAKFQELQNQLNPHFLFNSLNSVRALIFENKDKAAEATSKLSDFLRYNLSLGEYIFISLSQEIQAVKNYLSIEKFRHEDFLKVNYEIDAACEKFKVLPNILLPIVDNAVKYGIKTSGDALEINIKISKTNDLLKFEVSNTGRWVEESNATISKGHKLVNDRLENVFGDQFQFIIEKNEIEVIVKIHIPLIDEKNSSNYSN